MAVSTATRNLVLRTPALRMLLCRLGVLTGSVLTFGLLGCGGDATSPSAAADTFWTLRFNQHAVLLALTAPQNTIQLTATPLTVSGHAPVGVGPVQYAAQDSTVTVDATGLVTAHAVTFQTARVVATVTDTVHHVTLRDTCFLQVTATAPSAPLSGFTLQSGSGDTLALGQNFTLRTAATDANGNPVTAFAYFTSADSGTAKIDKFTGYLNVLRIDQVVLYAETWAYGVAKRDSLLLTVSLPRAATILVLPVTPTGSTHAVLTFWPQITTVATSAKVTWQNPSLTDSIDVVFDDPAHVDSAQYGSFLYRFATGRGNIAPWMNDKTGTAADSVSARICSGLQLFFDGPCSEVLEFSSATGQRLRSFPVAGTYHYHSATWGTSGTIVVQ